MRRALLIALAAASLAAPAFGQQVAVDGQNPQLPAALGPLGGLKVECLIGCGGGAVGADVNISGVGGVAVVGAALPVSGTVAFSNTSIGVTHANFANLDAALSTLANQATLALIKAKTDNLDVLLSTRTKPADAQHAIIDSGSVTFTNASIGITGSVAVTGPLTDTQLRASDVGVSLAAETTKVIGTVKQGTSPWVNNVSQFGGSAVSLGQGTSAGSIPVVLPSNWFPPPDRAVVGTIATNGAVASITSGGTGTVTVAITGTWVGSLLFFGIDGSGAGNALYAVNGVSGQPETSIAANGIWEIPSAGWSSIGLTSTSWTSGTASIALIAGAQSNVVALGRSLPTGVNPIGQVTANAGLNLNTSALALETTQIALNALVSSMQQTLASGTAMVTVPLVGPGPARTLRSPFACNALRKLGCS